MKTGIELIAEERAEQLDKHQRTIEDDVEYNPDGQIRDAACELAQDEPIFRYFPKMWQGKIMQHAISKSYKDRLVIAGALIAAEIDRIQNQISDV